MHVCLLKQKYIISNLQCIAIQLPVMEYYYSTAQIKLYIYMCMIVKSLWKFHEILTLNSMQAMYACIMLRSAQHMSNSMHVVLHKVQVSKPFKLRTKYVFNNYRLSSKYRVPVLVLIISDEYVHSMCSEQFLSFQGGSNTCNIWFASSCSISGVMWYTYKY